MKLTDYIYFGVISVFISVSSLALYDAVIITPKMKTNAIKVIDIDYILASSEKQVKADKLSIESYKKRIGYLERAISENPNVIFNKYIRLNGITYPVVFGGEDITDYFLKHVEAIE